MNRREAMKMGGVAAMAAVTGLSTEGAGCTSHQVEQEINVILQATANVLAAAGETAWSKTLSDAEQALAAAEAKWKAGGAVDILIDALDALEAVAAVIPLTAPYSPFIDVIVAAIETVLALLPAAAGNTATVAHREARVKAFGNPHRGRVPNFRSARSGAQQWNTVCAALPALKVARVKVPL